MSLSARQKKYIDQHHSSIPIEKIAKTLQIDPQLITHYLQSTSPHLSPRKKQVFFIIILSLPLLIFILLELVLQLAKYGDNLDLFIDAPKDFPQYQMANPKVARRFFNRAAAVPSPPMDLFLKNKPQNGYRIFILGGSTAAGYPFSANLLFSRILQRRLSDVFPERKIEVINLAMSAINSYALLDFIDEVLDKQADLILIYAGHNEYYGALGVASAESIGKYRPVVLLYLKLRHFKTFQLLGDGVRQIASFLGKGAEQDPSATLMERLVAEQNIVYKSELYERGKNHFKKNLQRLIEKARQKQVPVVMSELVSNVRDQEPFVSISTGQWPAARDVYQMAKEFESQGDFIQAQKNYYLAKDLDALRFRASEEFNDIIDELGHTLQVPVVPMKSVFENASPHGLIGSGLMLEHLHPTIKGYFLLADAFFKTLQNERLIAQEWDDQRIKNSEYYRSHWGFTELDSLYANLRIHILKGGWPFQPKTAPNKALSDYRPINRVDSLAAQVWSRHNYTLERAHVELAEYYERRKDFRRAFKEYQALMYLTPLNVSPYLRGADVLIKMQDLNSALPILQESLTLEETTFAHKWIGQIYLTQNKVKEALFHLEKAYQSSPNDLQLLYNLSGAYALDKQFKKSKALLERLLTLSPNFPEADLLQAQLEKAMK